MKYTRKNNTVIVRLEVGDELVSSLLEVAEKEKIGFAGVSGLGATDSFSVGVFDLGKKTYDRFDFSGSFEITGLSGNITVMDGSPYQHIHITCAGPGGKVVGGHLLECRISLTAEIILPTHSSTVFTALTVASRTPVCPTISVFAKFNIITSYFCEAINSSACAVTSKALISG